MSFPHRDTALPPEVKVQLLDGFLNTEVQEKLRISQPYLLKCFLLQVDLNLSVCGAQFNTMQQGSRSINAVSQDKHSEKLSSLSEQSGQSIDAPKMSHDAHRIHM